MLPNTIQEQLDRLNKVAELIKPNYGHLEHDLLLQEVRNLYLTLLEDSSSDSSSKLNPAQQIPESIQTPTPKQTISQEKPEEPTPSNSSSTNHIEQQVNKADQQKEEQRFEQFQPKQETQSPQTSVWDNLGNSSKQEKPSINQEVKPKPVQQFNQANQKSKPIASLIALADRYYLQRELFQNNASKMQDVLSSIDNTSQLDEAKEVIQPLKEGALSNQAFERINELVELKFQ